MGDYEATTTVSAPAERLFAYLSDVSNLPRYFSAMVSAERTGPEEVSTVAEVNGVRREGEAWFRVDEGRNRIEWGSEGDSDYSGHLEVSGNGSSSTVEVSVHTARAEGAEVQQGVEETVATIKRLVESSSEPTG